MDSVNKISVEKRKTILVVLGFVIAFAIIINNAFQRDDYNSNFDDVLLNIKSLENGVYIKEVDFQKDTDINGNESSKGESRVYVTIDELPLSDDQVDTLFEDIKNVIDDDMNSERENKAGFNYDLLNLVLYSFPNDTVLKSETRHVDEEVGIYSNVSLYHWNNAKK
ncbi:MAG: hypothetical protein ACK5LV_04000 [Lachnospirales bacterium]